MLRLIFFSSSVALALGQECGGGEDVCLVQTGGVLSTDGGADSESALNIGDGFVPTANRESSFLRSMGLSEEAEAQMLAELLVGSEPGEEYPVGLLQVHESEKRYGYGSYYGHAGVTSSGGSGGSSSAPAPSPSSSAPAPSPAPTFVCRFKLEVSGSFTANVDTDNCKQWRCPELSQLPSFLDYKTMDEHEFVPGETADQHTMNVRLSKWLFSGACPVRRNFYLDDSADYQAVYVGDQVVGYLANGRYFYATWISDSAGYRSRLQYVWN